MDDGVFSYVALDCGGRRIRGQVAAPDEATAFEQLRRDGLAPLTLKRAAPAAKPKPSQHSIGDRESAEVLSGLAELLRARADIRTALGILGDRFERASVKSICRQLDAEISSGEALERAFGRVFGGRLAFVPSMVAAGEAGGDLASGLERAAEVISSRLKLREQLVSVLAYPAFVFVSAIGAILVILLFIIPSVSPLVEQVGGEAPPALGFMIAASDLFRANLGLIGAGLGGATVVLALAARGGMLDGPIERLTLDGPLRRTIGGVVFGGFAQSLGAMLAAGAPISDALRLATRSVSSRAAQRRLEPLVAAVRQGQMLSDALASVRSFPLTITRLAAVGEASNTVGQLLQRAGKLEEEAALRRIEALGRIAGPGLIVVLGALLGVLMGGLLSGLSQMGQAVLN